MFACIHTRCTNIAKVCLECSNQTRSEKYCFQYSLIIIILLLYYTGAVTDIPRRTAVLARNTGLVRRFEKSKDCAPGLMFDNFLPIPDAEFLPFYPLVLKLVVCAFEFLALPRYFKESALHWFEIRLSYIEPRLQITTIGEL